MSPQALGCFEARNTTISDFFEKYLKWQQRNGYISKTLV